MSQIILNRDFIEKYVASHEVHSINHLAREIGISEATLHRVMNGGRRPGQKVISRMLTYFDTPFEQVFLRDEQLTKVNITV